MAVDYDAPRASTVEEEMETDSLESLQAAQADQMSEDDADDGEIVESYAIPDFDISGEDLNVDVVPKQANEFTCASCFLVLHRSRIAETLPNGDKICLDCA